MMKRRTFDHLLWLRAQRRQRSTAVIVIITRRSQIMDTLQRLRQYSKHCPTSREQTFITGYKQRHLIMDQSYSSITDTVLVFVHILNNYFS